MAFQTTAFGLDLWRFIAGVGIGVELVTIDTYIAELVPKQVRGRAFAFNQVVTFSAIPVVALLAWLLVPIKPFGLDGWRWVVLAGSTGALIVWFIRLAVPESPRWLAQNGRAADADAIVTRFEREAEDAGATLAAPQDDAAGEMARGSFGEIFRAPYLSRTLMLIAFNLFQTVGFYGFNNWVPSFLIKQGIAVTASLGYTFVIAIAAPFGPLIAALFSDRIERKWAIVGGALCVAGFGLVFGHAREAVPLIVFGVLVDAVEQHHVVLIPRLSGRTVSHAHPRHGGRLRLFLQPAVHRVQRLRHRLLPRPLRHRRRVRADRRLHGRGGARHRPVRPAGAQSFAGADFEVNPVTLASIIGHQFPAPEQAGQGKIAISARSYGPCA